MPPRVVRGAVVLLTLALSGGCGRPTGENAADSQKLPFDRKPNSTGISPSRSVIPSTTKLPEGTSIAVRLQSTLSSMTSHAGDNFRATIDEPITVDGQTLIVPGTTATGRVLEAKPSGRSLEPGYLRVVLESVNVDGKPVMIETSSIFAKGSSRDERPPASGTASGAGQKDIVFGIDRRLNFRLAQTVDLQ
jgi:hypothetical protein